MIKKEPLPDKKQVSSGYGTALRYLSILIFSGLVDTDILQSIYAYKNTTSI
jgi:hypothetical protein